MAKFGKLVTQGLSGLQQVGGGLTAVDNLITSFSKATSKPESYIDKVRATSLTKERKLITLPKSSQPRPVSEIVTRNREDLQTLKSFAYPEDPSPYETRIYFLEFRPYSVGAQDSAIALINKSLADQQALTTKPFVNSVIALPLPANLVESISAEFEQFDAGLITPAIAQAAYGVGKTALSKGASFSGVADAVISEGKRLGSTFLTEEAFRAALRAIVNGTTDSIRGVISTTTGEILNPNRALQFNGVGLRTYEYSWKFSPNSREESKTVRDIVHHLQMKSLPSKPQGEQFFLKYPDLVLVKFQRLEERLYQHKLCFIESVSVNYAPSGQPAFFHDTNEPVETEITIKLRETSIRTRNDYPENKKETGR
jgi:hypothetical protein